MKYIRYNAPPELRLRFHFRDKFGADIIGARDYDPVTGVAHIVYPGSDTLIEVFKPEGYVEIDGHVNPSQEVLDSIFANSRLLIQSKEVLDNTVMKLTEVDKFEKGQKENNPQTTD